MSFFETIGKLQEEHGESNYRLAKELGVSQSTIANWKSGKVKPLPVYQEKLAEHFGVTMDYLNQSGAEESEGNDKP